MKEKTNKDKSKKGAWRNLYILAGAQLVDLGESSILNTMFTVIRQSINLNVGHLGIINFAKRIVGMIFAPIWGMVADRFSRKFVLVWATGVWGVWTIFVGFSQSYHQMLILSVIAGIGLVALQSPLNSLISDLFPEKKRGKAFGIVRAISFVGAIVVLVFLGQMAEKAPAMGWRISFWAFGGLSMLSGLLIWLFVDEPVRGGTEAAISDVIDEIGDKSEATYRFELKKFPQIFKIPTMIVILIEYIPMTFYFTTVYVFFITWLVDERGFSAGMAPIVFAMFVVGMAIGTALGGIIGDWADRKSPSKGRILVAQVSIGVMAVVLFFLYQVEWESRIMYWVLSFLFGLFLDVRYTGAVAPMTSAVLLPEVRTTGFAIEQTSYTIVFAVASYIIGQIGVSIGLTKAFLWAGNAAAVITFLLWFIFYPLYHRDAGKVQEALAERRSRLTAN